MAQHNARVKDQIADAAHRLFLENGYDATSYRDIAEAVGRDRTIVQYHYPRKETLALTLLDRVVALIEEHLSASGLHSDDPLAYRVELAQLYFSFLLDPDVRQFALDVLARRTITRRLSVTDAEWNANHLDAKLDERRQIIEQGILAIGGAYELIYHHALTGEPIDVRWLARQTVANSIAPSEGDAPGSATFAELGLDETSVQSSIRAILDEL